MDTQTLWKFLWESSKWFAIHFGWFVLGVVLEVSINDTLPDFMFLSRLFGIVLASFLAVRVAQITFFSCVYFLATDATSFGKLSKVKLSIVYGLVYLIVLIAIQFIRSKLYLAMGASFLERLLF